MTGIKRIAGKLTKSNDRKIKRWIANVAFNLFAIDFRFRLFLRCHWLITSSNRTANGWTSRMRILYSPPPPPPRSFASAGKQKTERGQFEWIDSRKILLPLQQFGCNYKTLASLTDKTWKVPLPVASSPIVWEKCVVLCCSTSSSSSLC